MALLFSEQVSNGHSSPVTWYGGEGTFYAQGLFDGGTISLQASFDGGKSWIDVGRDVKFECAGAGNFRLGKCDVRASLTGAKSPRITAGI